MTANKLKDFQIALERVQIGNASAEDIRFLQTTLQSGGINFGQNNEISIQGSVIYIEGIEPEHLKELILSLHQIKPPPPLELPERPSYFRGREEELNQLLKDLKPGKIVTLTGPGGIGKTSLAAETLWQITDGENTPEDFPDGVLFHSFYKQPQVELAFEHIVRSYGEEPQPTAPLAAQRVLSGKQVLLMLDGAEAADDLGALLAMKGNCCMLVTSRDKGDIKEEWQNLDSLKVEEGAKLLQDWGGARAQDAESTEEITKMVGGLPMALRLAGQYLKISESDAQEYRLWLEESPLEALNHGDRQKESMPILLKKCLERVSKEAKSALGVIGLLAIAPFNKNVMVEALDTSVVNAVRWLGELARFEIVRRNSKGYQVTHALVHTYARMEVAPPKGSLERLGGYYKSLVREKREQGLEGYRILDSERVHIMRVLAKLGEEGKWQEVLDLAWAMDSYLDIQGHWIERVQACKEGLKASRGLNDRRNEGTWLGNLGIVYRNLGEVRHAINHFEATLVIAREVGDRRREGVHLGNIGLAYTSLGELERAIDSYKAALAIAREIGDRRNEGNWLGDLGNAYADKGDVERAIENFEIALVIVREIGDRRGEGFQLGNLGMAYQNLGKVEQAIENLEAALIIAREIGDRRNEGTWLNNIGLAYANQGFVEQAIEHYKDALDIAREIGDRRGEAARMGNLGNAYTNLGDVKGAIECHEQALEISREIGDQRGETIRLGNLGNAYADLGNVPRAIEYYLSALEISREIGDRHREAVNLGNLGTAYSDLGKVEGAMEHHEDALAIAREIGDRHQEAARMGSIGKAYADLGERSLAIEYYFKSIEISREIGDRYREGNELGNLGNIYFDLMEVPQAIEYYQQALEISREFNDRRNEGIWLGNLGLAYATLGDVPRAIEYYVKRLEISREMGNRSVEGNELGNLGNAYFDLGEVPRAIEHYHQALEISRELSDRRNEGIWLGNLGNAYINLGEVPRAIKYYEQALKISNEISDQHYEGIWLGNLGKAYQSMGEREIAKQFFNEALEIFESLESPNADWARLRLKNLGKMD